MRRANSLLCFYMTCNRWPIDTHRTCRSILHDGARRNLTNCVFSAKAVQTIIFLARRVLDPRACALSPASTAAFTAPMIGVTQLASVYALYCQMNQAANEPNKSFGEFVSVNFRVLIGYSQVRLDCVIHDWQSKTVSCVFLVPSLNGYTGSSTRLSHQHSILH